MSLENQKVSLEEYRDACKILGVSGGTYEEIKHRYHELLKKYHPDNISGSGDLARTREIVDAFDIITRASSYGIESVPSQEQEVPSGNYEEGGSQKSKRGKSNPFSGNSSDLFSRNSSDLFSGNSSDLFSGNSSDLFSGKSDNGDPFWNLDPFFGKPPHSGGGRKH